MASPLRIQLDRIRRRWLLVVLVVALALATAAAAALAAKPTYTGRAALTTASKSRSPDQDAALTQGYVAYFNEKSYQELIANKLGVPPDVSFTARAAATSPILFIEASSKDRDVASTMATKLAETFRDEVRGQLGATQDDIIADLQKQVEEARARLDKSPAPEERVIILQEIFDLQSRETDVRGDTTNQLKDLSLDAGVASSSPNLLLNILLALVGGLVLGCVLAITIALVENRLISPWEIRNRLGLDTLTVVADHGRRLKKATSTQRLKGLANAVSLADLGRPGSVAITTPRATNAKSLVAEGLAYYRAMQGERTLLLQCDLRQDRTAAPGGYGVADVLAAAQPAALRPVEVPAGSNRLMVVPPGESTADAFTLFSAERSTALVKIAGELADLVVIEAPALLDAAEGRAICAAATRTILVIEEGVTGAEDATAACELLEQVGATVLGAVIVGKHVDGPSVLAGCDPPAALTTVAPTPQPEDHPDPGTTAGPAMTTTPADDLAVGTSGARSPAELVSVAATDAASVTSADGVSVNASPLNGSSVNGTPSNGSPVYSSAVNGTPVNGSPVNGSRVSGTSADDVFGTDAVTGNGTAPTARWRPSPVPRHPHTDVDD